MGNKQSSASKASNQDVVNQSGDGRGQIMDKGLAEAQAPLETNTDAEAEALNLVETESDYDSDEDSDDDEDVAERLRILEDAKQLKRLAVAFLHPELPVETESTACARCYFDRASAPEQESFEEAEERRMVLEEAAALKKLAVDYAHPEIGVTSSDPTVTARCYFDRASAPEQESFEEAEERRMALADAAALKKLAVDYMHPEIGVVTADPTATARCYFDRASAPEKESLEEVEERNMILEDAQKLREAARQFLHPEIGVTSSDPTATARCYFDRASAPEQESFEDAEERRMVLEEAAALKKLAVDYMHPEIGVVTADPTATARCYFDRASAHQQESLEEAEERRMALADAAALKRLAVDYMHPEIGVTTSDATATARCYFDRASAPEQESLEEAEERRMALADAAALKRLAVDYMHPEIGVTTSDATATARCYFDRASAPQQESLEEAEERRMALADAAALKRLAVDYMHPEIGVTTSDATATARCYFDRASAPEQESPEEAEERRMALADAAALKRLAVDYMHPEIGVVTTDPTATARCYFDRASAPQQKSETEEVAVEKLAEPAKSNVSKVMALPVTKEVGVKTIQPHTADTGITKSPSAVHLFGLDDEHGDPAF